MATICRSPPLSVPAICLFRCSSTGKNLKTDNLVRPEPGNILTLKPYFPGSNGVETGDGPEQTGLAGTVGTDYGDYFPFVYGQGNIRQDHHLSD